MGFPVLAELFQGWRRPSQWTIHTRLTVWGSLLLFVVAAVLFLVYEWGNAATIGTMSWPDKLVSGVEASTMTRSGGLNSFDWGSVQPESLNIATVLMFIGGGSASTAGGIKITTFLLLGFVILAELRGDPDVTIGRRSISAAVIRTALSIALIAVMLVIGSTFIVMSMTDFAFDEVLFECASAFGTVGLSTGITAAAARRRADDRRRLDVRRQSGHDCSGVRVRPASSHDAVPPSRGATDHWLSQAGTTHRCW